MSTPLHSLLDGVRVVIFDADDTLRRTTVAGQPCPRAPNEWELLPNVRETLTAIDWRARNIRLAVASNQDQVGYGLFTREMAEQLLRDMMRAAVDDSTLDPLIRICTHTLDVSCDCRKPNPGMLLDIMRTLGSEPHTTLFIGNASSDEQAARRAGVRFAWAQEVFAAEL